jgi:hypothetical protein
MRYYIIRTKAKTVCIYKTLDAAQIMFTKLAEGEMCEEDMDLVLCVTDDYGRVQSEVILYMYCMNSDVIQVAVVV